MEKKKRKSPKSGGLKRARRQAVNVAEMSLVKKSYIEESKPFPLVFTPATGNVDLVQWASANVPLIEEELKKHGAILCRGFGVASVSEFAAYARAVCPNLYGEYGDLPDENKKEKVYKSTPYPKDKMILYHNESSHMHQWPTRQFFHCVKASEEGGETPLVDCRKLYRELDPKWAEMLLSKKLLYRRNFIEGLDVSWQEFFQTPEKSVVEEKCRARNMNFQWIAENHLRTEQIAPAIIRHPDTGDLSFFNQIQLHHISYLDQKMHKSMATVFKEENYPRNVYFGDGEPLPEALLDEANRLYDTCSVAYPWQEGDVITLDNMLVAHARNPFKGERKIVVAMSALVQAKDIEGA